VTSLARPPPPTEGMHKTHIKHVLSLQRTRKLQKLAKNRTQLKFILSLLQSVLPQAVKHQLNQTQRLSASGNILMLRELPKGSIATSGLKLSQLHLPHLSLLFTARVCPEL